MHNHDTTVYLIGAARSDGALNKYASDTIPPGWRRFAEDTLEKMTGHSCLLATSGQGCCLVARSWVGDVASDSRAMPMAAGLLLPEGSQIEAEILPRLESIFEWLGAFSYEDILAIREVDTKQGVSSVLDEFEVREGGPLPPDLKTLSAALGHDQLQEACMTTLTRGSPEEGLRTLLALPRAFHRLGFYAPLDDEIRGPLMQRFNVTARPKHQKILAEGVQNRPAGKLFELRSEPIDGKRFSESAKRLGTLCQRWREDLGNEAFRTCPDALSLLWALEDHDVRVHGAAQPLYRYQAERATETMTSPDRHTRKQDHHAMTVEKKPRLALSLKVGLVATLLLAGLLLLCAVVLQAEVLRADQLFITISIQAHTVVTGALLVAGSILATWALTVLHFAHQRTKSKGKHEKKGDIYYD